MTLAQVKSSFISNYMRRYEACANATSRLDPPPYSVVYVFLLQATKQPDRQLVKNVLETEPNPCARHIRSESFCTLGIDGATRQAR